MRKCIYCNRSVRREKDEWKHETFCGYVRDRGKSPLNVN